MQWCRAYYNNIAREDELFMQYVLYGRHLLSMHLVKFHKLQWNGGKCNQPERTTAAADH